MLGAAFQRFIVAAICAACVGCANKPNHRWAYSGNLEFGAELDPDGTAHYNYVKVGTKEVPFDGRGNCIIRLRGGQEFRLDKLNGRVLRPFAVREFGVYDPSDKKSRLPPGSVALIVPPYELWVTDERLLLAVIVSPGYTEAERGTPQETPLGHETPVAAVADGIFYTLPLTQQQVEKIFGPVGTDRVVDAHLK
jgi:hypothetical protein